MRRMLHLIPFVVAYLEYQAITLAMNFVRFEGEGQPFTAFHGLLRVGENYSFYSVSGLVRMLHIVALVLALGYFVAVTLLGYKKEEDEVQVEPTMF